MKHNHCRPFDEHKRDNIVSITVPCVDLKELLRQRDTLLLIANPGFDVTDYTDGDEHLGLINLLDYMLHAAEVWDK